MPDFLQDLKNGKTLKTHHLATGVCRAYSYDAKHDEVFVETFVFGKLGATSEYQSWTDSFMIRRWELLWRKGLNEGLTSWRVSTAIGPLLF